MADEKIGRNEFGDGFAVGFNFGFGDKYDSSKK
jgi:hypothetical protein